jgi:hypothetical protein
MISLRYAPKFLLPLFLSNLTIGSAIPSTSGSSCDALPTPNVPGLEILSMKGTVQYNASTTIPYTSVVISGLEICNVTVVLTHPGENDTVGIAVWLPLSGWNGRFQYVCNISKLPILLQSRTELTSFRGTGGGGFSVGHGDGMLGPAIQQGYAAASTDGGIFSSDNDFGLATHDLLPDRSLNYPLLVNFGSRSIHDMTVVGKIVTESYFGRAADFAYFNGCSNGGREGMGEAQLWPEDYDGIMAGAPAINFGKLAAGPLMWPYVVMQNEVVPSTCIFDTFINATIELCDGLDGVKDGIIANVEACHFDPFSIVGKMVDCPDKEKTITRDQANVWNKILGGMKAPDGTFLWYGWNQGTPISTPIHAVVDTTTFTNGTSAAAPYPLPDNWIKIILERNASFDTSHITYEQLTDYFYETNRVYGPLLSLNDPDLSKFRDSGGKLITWHGLADNVLPPKGTIDYRQKVDALLGGPAAIDEFYRLFFAPGVGHCGAGYGPVPVDPLGALVSWVENGTAPETLASEFMDSEGDVVTADICKWPLVSRYDGKGDTKLASSYSCTSSS